MAVFTKIYKNDLENFLNCYSLGKLISFEGIVEGIENSNFKIITDQGKYILTIFEKRVNIADLPFFIDLLHHLSKNDFTCPIPMKNNGGEVINKLCNKSAVLMSFLEGRQILQPTPIHCKQVGKTIGKLFKINASFNQKRNNSLGLKKWKEIFYKCQNFKGSNFLNFIEPINNELIFLESNWPKNLPVNIIHADLFRDNIFFHNDKLSGVIDFYFSCNDFNTYELAITTNDWCFDTTKGFLKDNFKSLIEGYNTHHILTKEEINTFNIVLRGAAIRILVTRLYDTIFHNNKDIVNPKDPNEFLHILKWHQKNLIFDI